MKFPGKLLSFLKCCISNIMDGSEDFFFSDFDESSLMSMEYKDVYNIDGEDASNSQLIELYEYLDSEK